MQDVHDVMDMLLAAKYASPNLARFVRENPGYASGALRILRAAIDTPESLMQLRTIHALTRDRIVAAQSKDNTALAPAMGDAERLQLQVRIAHYVQDALDKLDARQFWSAETHMQLEAQFYLEVIAPLKARDKIVDGHINIGLTERHALVVGSVTLEPK